MSQDTVGNQFKTDFKLLAENIPHIVWAASPDGSTEYFNDRGCLFTGMPREANYGWGWVSLIHEDDAERARSDWDVALKSLAPLEAHWKVRRSDGEFRRMAVRGVPVFDAEGTLTQWVGTCTDIEEEQRLQDHLVQSQLEAAESLMLLETL